MDRFSEKDQALLQEEGITTKAQAKEWLKMFPAGNERIGRVLLTQVQEWSASYGE